MNSLRDKYMAMEKKFKKKIRKMEETSDALAKKNEELTMKLERESTSNQDLSAQINTLDATTTATSNSHLADRLKLEKRVEKLDGKLTEKNALYESISDKYREFRIESRSSIDGLKDEIRNLKKDNDESEKQREQMEQQKKKVEVELIECQENVTLKGEEVVTLKNENFEAKDTIRSWEHKCKKLEMDIEQEKEVCTKYERENQSLRKQVLELEEEIKSGEKQLAEINKSETRWSQNIVDLRTDVSKKENDIKLKDEKIAEFEAKISQFTEDQHRLNEQMTDIKDKLSQANEALIGTNEGMKKLEDTNLELKKDNIIKTDAIDRFEPEKEGLLKDVNKYREANGILQIECNNLTQKLKVANKLENINLDEFKTLCSTNLRVADSIKTLMSTIGQAPDAQKENIDQANV